MRDGDKKNPLKTLLVDIFMGLNFLFLLVIAIWIVWVYYVRGPIDIVTGKGIAEPEQNILIRAREEYSTHFHNMDKAVLNGIQTGSLCLECHGDYPHHENKKVRGLFNAHSWFIACEVCHLKSEDEDQIVYKWLDNNTGNELEELEGSIGNYGAAIIPLKSGHLGKERLDKPADVNFILEYIQRREHLNEELQKEVDERFHETMTKEPVFCDKCHTENGIFDFEELLYSPKRALHLETIDMGAMAKTYEEFHFPSIFEP